jgi:flagellar assembly protein FliH
MSSSRPKFRNVPPPPGHDAKASVYSRFIPREELDSFSAWTPGTFAEGGAPASGVQRAASEPAGPTAEDIARQLHTAHQAGYADGYRDGLAALEQFKQSVAQQAGAQLAALLQSTQAQLEALQQEMARSLAVAATQLARQVVRSELVQRPELVVQVAEEALDTLLQGALHLTVRVHPDDHALVARGAADRLAERGVRLLADASITRGGCSVESDTGVIDAGIESRWHRAAAALGIDDEWHRSAAGAGDGT